MKKLIAAALLVSASIPALAQPGPEVLFYDGDNKVFTDGKDNLYLSCNMCSLDKPEKIKGVVPYGKAIYFDGDLIVFSVTGGSQSCLAGSWVVVSIASKTSRELDINCGPEISDYKISGKYISGKLFGGKKFREKLD